MALLVVWAAEATATTIINIMTSFKHSGRLMKAPPQLHSFHSGERTEIRILAGTSRSTGVRISVMGLRYSSVLITALVVDCHLFNRRPALI